MSGGAIVVAIALVLVLGYVIYLILSKGKCTDVVEDLCETQKPTKKDLTDPDFYKSESYDSKQALETLKELRAGVDKIKEDAVKQSCGCEKSESFDEADEFYGTKPVKTEKKKTAKKETKKAEPKKKATAKKSTKKTETKKKTTKAKK